MRKNQFLGVLVLGGLLGTSLVACEHKGPAEKAGEKIDAAARDVKEGAEKAADKVEKAADDLQDKAKEKK